MKQRKILIVYNCGEFPTRETYSEYLSSFKTYSSDLIYYLNIKFLAFPNFLKKIKFDAVIYYLITPWSKNAFIQKINLLKLNTSQIPLKIAFFQDEFFYANLFCDFINELRIKFIYTVIPKREQHKFYYNINYKKVKIKEILTGYIEENKIKQINRLIGKKARLIDIGYRTAYSAPFYLGYHGMLKKKIADVFIKNTYNQKLIIDIDASSQKMFFGNDWYRFLGSCKYTLGVESGSSLLDKDGKFYEGVIKYQTTKPQANFEEIKSLLFKNNDGQYKSTMLSPRHLEACLTKTCQILIEGKYNGILKPWVHYIPLKKDFSNIGQVIEIVKKDNLRKKIVEKAYRDIVLSKKYTYNKFIRQEVNKAMSGIKNPFPIDQKDLIYFKICYIYDQYNWLRAYIYSKLVNLYYLIKSISLFKTINK